MYEHENAISEVFYFLILLKENACMNKKN